MEPELIAGDVDELERQLMEHELAQDKYPDEGEYDEHGKPLWIINPYWLIYE